jgi:4-hydroxybenzoate polyprenyltransferase
MTAGTTRVADSTGNWVDTYAPLWARPYLRLSRFDRPIGSWLLLMPCWWSAALATGIARDVQSLAWTSVLFFIGAFVMRGAGCTWNDITDRDLDAKVERTRSRPIPSGQVTARQAGVYLVAQALIGLGVLLQFNRFAVILARIDAIALLLYAGSISWVIGYDTIYAHQDREDDALIGIKSTALLFGERTRTALAAFYGLALVLMILAFVLAHAQWPAFLGLAAFALHLIWQIVRVDIRDPLLCLRLFKSNRDAGLLLFAGLLADAVLRTFT